jgi:hypothetical protein
MTPLLGVDISLYQWRNGIPATILARLKAGGVRYIIARASVGDRIDPSFQENIKRIRKAHLMPGAYHFLTDGDPGSNSVAPQVDVYLRQIRAVGLEGMLTALDVERGGRPTYAESVAFAQGFDAGTPNHDLGVYSNRSTWASFGNPDVLDHFDYAWQALYALRAQALGHTSFPQEPPHGFGGVPADLWQWGPLLVPGRTKILRLDGDAFYGTFPELVSMAALKVKPPRPNPNRTPWKDGYNAAASAMQSAARAVQVPANAGPFFEGGFKQAKRDGLGALNELEVS